MLRTLAATVSREPVACDGTGEDEDEEIGSMLLPSTSMVTGGVMGDARPSSERQALW